MYLNFKVYSKLKTLDDSNFFSLKQIGFHNNIRISYILFNAQHYTLSKLELYVRFKLLKCYLNKPSIHSKDEVLRRNILNERDDWFYICFFLKEDKIMDFIKNKI